VLTEDAGSATDHQLFVQLVDELHLRASPRILRKKLERIV
jgi:hypothetical protein